MHRDVKNRDSGFPDYNCVGLQLAFYVHCSFNVNILQFIYGKEVCLNSLKSINYVIKPTLVKNPMIYLRPPSEVNSVFRKFCSSEQWIYYKLE